jgi:ABC-type polysaccharide/polyol phosphate export permease
MIPALFESGMILYGIIQVLIACIAVILAVKWDKFEFLAGLLCLLLYAIIEVITTFFFTINQGLYIDIAQFGFIMLAIVFFIIGMHPSWAPQLASGMGARSPPVIKPVKNESVISLLKKQP